MTVDASLWHDLPTALKGSEPPHNSPLAAVLSCIARKPSKNSVTQTKASSSFADLTLLISLKLGNPASMTITIASDRCRHAAGS